MPEIIRPDLNNLSLAKSQEIDRQNAFQQVAAHVSNDPQVGTSGNFLSKFWDKAKNFIGTPISPIDLSPAIKEGYGLLTKAGGEAIKFAEKTSQDYYGRNYLSSTGPAPAPKTPLEATSTPAGILDMFNASKAGTDIFSYMDTQAKNSGLASSTQDIKQGGTDRAMNLGVNSSQMPPDYSASGKAAAAGFIESIPILGSSMAAAVPTSQFANYQPKTTSEYAAYTFANTLGMFAGMEAVGTGLKGMGIGTIAEGDTVSNLTRNKFVGGSLDFLQQRFPNTFNLIVDKTGFNAYELVDGALNSAATLNAYTQLTLPQQTAMKDRLNAMLPSTLMALTLHTAGLTSMAPRVTLFSAYGFTDGMLRTGSPDKALISAATWGSMGAMGGLPASREQMERKLTGDAFNKLSSIVGVDSKVVDEMKAIVNDAKQNPLSYIAEAAPISSVVEAPVAPAIPVATKEVAGLTVKAPETPGKEMVIEKKPLTTSEAKVVEKNKKVVETAKKFQVETKKAEVENSKIISTISPIDFAQKLNTKNEIDIGKALIENNIKSSLDLELQAQGKEQKMLGPAETSAESGITTVKRRGGKSALVAEADPQEKIIADILEEKILGYSIQDAKQTQAKATPQDTEAFIIKLNEAADIVSNPENHLTPEEMAQYKKAIDMGGDKSKKSDYPDIIKKAEETLQAARRAGELLKNKGYANPSLKEVYEQMVASGDGPRISFGVTGHRTENPATIAQKSQAKMVARYFAKGGTLDAEIDALKYPSDVNQYVKDLILAKAKDIIKRLDAGKTIDDKLNLGVDNSKLNDIWSRFSKTGGTEADLAQAIVESYGASKIGRGYQARANKLVPELRFETVKDMYSWLDSEFPKEMSLIRSNNQAIGMTKTAIAEATKISADLLPSYDPEQVMRIRRDFERTNLTPKQMEDIKSPSDNAMKTIEALNLTILNRRPRSPRAIGETEGIAGKVITLSKKADAGTAFHEAAHGIDVQYGIGKKLDTMVEGNIAEGIKNELDQLITPARGRTYEPGKLLSEAIAEYGRVYMMGDKVDQFPLMNKFFEAVLKKEDPTVWNVVEGARHDSMVWNNMPDLGRMKAMVYQENEGRIIKNVKDSYNDGTLVNKTKATLTDLYRNQVNNTGDYSDLNKAWGLKGVDSLEGRYKYQEPMTRGLSQMFFAEGVPTIETLKAWLSMDGKKIVDLGKKAYQTRSLEEIMMQVPVTLREDFGIYMLSKQIDQRYETALNKGEVPTRIEGFGPAEVAGAIKNVESMMPEAAKVAEEWAAYDKAQLDLLVELGHMTGEQHQKITENPFFASLVRKQGLYTDDFEFNKSSADTIFKQYRGSTNANLVDPFLSKIYGSDAIARRIVRGDLLQRLAKNALEKGGNEHVQHVVPDLKATKISPEEVVKFMSTLENYTSEERASMIRQLEANPELIPLVFRPNRTNDPGVFRINLGDETKYIRLSPRMADSMGMSDKSITSNMVLDAFKSYTKLKKALSTTFSLNFLAKNPLRDTLDAYMRAKATFIPVVDTMKGLKIYMDGVRGKGGLAWEIGKMYGLQNEYQMAEDTNSIRQQIFGRGNFKEINTLQKYGGKFLDAMRTMSNGGEMATRLGVLNKYDLTTPDGIFKGLQDAQQATFRWDTRGMSDSAITRWNQYQSFFRANVNAFDQDVKYMISDPKTILKRGSLITLASVAYGYMMKDDKAYWNNSAYNQLTGINIPIGGGKFVKLPFLGNPYFMGFWVLPQMAMHEAFQNGAPGQTFDMTKQALMQELPFQGTTMIDPGQIVLSAAVPDVLQPLISTTINKNLYNWTDLVSTTLAKLPASEQFSRGTSGLAVQIAKGLGAMGIEVSPIHIDNYLRGYLSSSYTQSTQTLDFLTQQLGMKWNPVKPDGNILNIAGLSAFIAQASPSSSFEVMQAASSYNQYQTYDTAWKLMIKDGRITEASQFYKDHQAELINFQVLKGFKSALTNLQNVYYKIQDNPRLSQEEAKTQSDNISNQIFDMAQRTNDVLSQYESHK